MNHYFLAVVNGVINPSGVIEPAVESQNRYRNDVKSIKVGKGKSSFNDIGIIDSYHIKVELDGGAIGSAILSAELMPFVIASLKDAYTFDTTNGVRWLNLKGLNFHVCKVNDVMQLVDHETYEAIRSNEEK